jgi:CIC family chloride channel protein
VQLAGGLASNLAGWLGEPKQKRRTAAAAGAAAGLAAAFNTPLAAMTFVLEEVIEDLNSRLLGRVLLASVIGALVVHGAIGAQPAFKLGSVSASSWEIYLLTPLVAVVGSLIGVVFQKSTMGIRKRRHQIPLLPAWARPAIGGIITWALGSAVFLQTGRLGVFSLGYPDLSAALNDDLGWKLAGIFVLTKLIATVSCYGFGGCGGIFSPLLFLGGMAGYFIAGASSNFAHLGPDDRIVLAVVGMSSCLGAVVRAPVTGILIVFEMTHEFSIVPALMIGALISQAISLRLCRHSFYDEILVQDGHKLEHVIPPRDLRSWQQLPVSAIANFNPVSVNPDDPARVAELLRAHPYNAFPALRDDRPIGMLRRSEAESALTEAREFRVDSAVFGSPTQSVRELQALLIESPTHVVLLQNEEGRMLGLVTLHDLLRAQAVAAEGDGAT